jgi:hypothetical protein
VFIQRILAPVPQELLHRGRRDIRRGVTEVMS